MLAVVVSRADSASVHIGEQLLESENWRERTDSSRADGDGGGTVYRTGWHAGEPGPDAVELREFDALHLELDGVAEVFGRVDGDGNGGDDGDGADGRPSPDVLVFASRHAGETGRLLTAHHIGNAGDAEYGGETGRFARACPNAHRNVLSALAEHAPPDYEVGTECTHHGPSRVGAPSMFVEVGSDEPQWADPDAARAVANAVLDLRGVAPDAPVERGDDRRAGDASDDGRRQLVGFGGGHYAPRFERITRETDWGVGHVAADWGLDAMGDPRENRAVVRRAFERSATTRAVVEGEYPALKAVIDDLGYRVVGETWVRETTGVPLDLVERLEDELAPVGEGLRFGDGARARADTGEEAPVGEAGESVGEGAGSVGGFEVVSLPDDLIGAAEGIDADQTRTAAEAATLAFETAQNGTRVAGRAAVGEEGSLDGFVEDLAGLLERTYDSVEVDDDAVVAEERAFDPEKARTLGVPDGPAFGKLSSGEPVEVDGRTVPPEEVHVEREHRFEY